MQWLIEVFLIFDFSFLAEQAAKLIRVQERSGDVRAGWLKGQLPERPLSPVEEGQIESGGSRRQNVRTRALEIFRHPAKANLLCASQGKTQDSANWNKVILDAMGIHRGSPSLVMASFFTMLEGGAEGLPL